MAPQRPAASSGRARASSMPSVSRQEEKIERATAQNSSTGTATSCANRQRLGAKALRLTRIPSFDAASTSIKSERSCTYPFAMADCPIMRLAWPPGPDAARSSLPKYSCSGGGIYTHLHLTTPPISWRRIALRRKQPPLPGVRIARLRLFAAGIGEHATDVPAACGRKQHGSALRSIKPANVPCRPKIVKEGGTPGSIQLMK